MTRHHRPGLSEERLLEAGGGGHLGVGPKPTERGGPGKQWPAAKLCVCVCMHIYVIVCRYKHVCSMCECMLVHVCTHVVGNCWSVRIHMLVHVGVHVWCICLPKHVAVCVRVFLIVQHLQGCHWVSLFPSHPASARMQVTGCWRAPWLGAGDESPQFSQRRPCYSLSRGPPAVPRC